MKPEPQPEPSLTAWSDDERRHFLEDRARLLRRLLDDRQAWQDTHERLGRPGSLQVTWFDHEGCQQQTLLTRSFLDGHDSVLRAVACDLIICGEDGAQIAEQVFADLSEFDGEPGD
jgi:hypothetical protein